MPEVGVKDRRNLTFIDFMHVPDEDLDAGQGLAAPLTHYEQASDLTALRQGWLPW